MTTMLAVAFANAGRGTPRQTSVAVGRIADHLEQFERAALLLNEIDEADTADEHGEFSAAFRQWEGHAWTTREPILTKGVKVKRTLSIRAAQGVARQSPARRVHEVIVDGGSEPDLVLMGGHPPAGAKNGRRAAKVKALLVVQYLVMWRLIRRRVRHHQKAGRHVVVAMDGNWRAMPALHRAEALVIKHGPDFIRVVPATGWTVRAPRRGDVDLGIEAMHRLLWAVLSFRRINTRPIGESA